MRDRTAETCELDVPARRLLLETTSTRDELAPPAACAAGAFCHERLHELPHAARRLVLSGIMQADGRRDYTDRREFWCSWWGGPLHATQVEYSVTQLLTHRWAY